MISHGMLGEMMLVEGWLGRNDPTGAWEYHRHSISHRKRSTGAHGKERCPRSRSIPIHSRAGVAGENTALAWQASAGALGQRHDVHDERERSAQEGDGHGRNSPLEDCRNMPDVHGTLFYYGDLPVYMRLNQGTEMPETYRFQGSKEILKLRNSV